MNQLSINRNFLLVTLGGLVGSIFEWYDFTVFIFLAPFLTKLFFPHTNPYISLMQVYGVFFLGYLVRPLGGAILGHYGDRIGRQKTLVSTIALMTLSTVGVGLLPSFSQVGYWAPAGLIVLRLIQGLATSGEAMGAMTFAFESAPMRHRGMLATIIWVGAGAGIVIASLFVGVLSSRLSNEAMLHWGWRIPFVFGLVTGIVGYLIRNRTAESVYFSAMIKRGELVRYPLMEIIKKYKKELLIIILLMIPHEVSYYIFFIFLPTYSSKFLGYNLSKILIVNTITMSYIFILAPVFAFFSDRVGRKPFIIISLVALVLCSVTLFDLVATGVLSNFFIAQSVFALIHSLYVAGIFSASLEMVPTRVRYSIVALGFNIAYAIFGASTPLVVTYLIHRNKSLIVPAFYVIIVSLFALLAILKTRETYKEVIL